MKNCYGFREVSEKTVLEKQITVQRYDGMVLWICVYIAFLLITAHTPGARMPHFI